MDQQLPEAGRCRRKLLKQTAQVTLPGDRNVLQLDCADDCTTM